MDGKFVIQSLGQVPWAILSELDKLMKIYLFNLYPALLIAASTVCFSFFKNEEKL